MCEQRCWDEPGECILLVVEDIGCHNTLDRLRGECALQGIDPAGKVILSSGRVTSEMLRKAAQMGVAVVISRTSPSSLAVEPAEAWGNTLIGHARGSRFRVYAHPWRIAWGKRFVFSEVRARMGAPSDQPATRRGRERQEPGVWPGSTHKGGEEFIQVA